MFRICSLIVLAFTVTACERNKGFTVKKIRPRISSGKWHNEGNIELAKTILSDTFSYLDSGSHTYVFANNDYVIKFFKQNRLDKEQDFTSCHLALTVIPETTGIVYFHPAKSTEFKSTTTFIDQRGSSFTLDMNNQEFIIQKRVEVGFAALECLIENGEIETAFTAIASLFDLVKKRASKELFDRDLQICKNFGFIGAQPIEIDIGNLRHDVNAQERIVEQLFNLEGQLREWIHAKYPHLRAELETFIQGVDHAA